MGNEKTNSRKRWGADENAALVLMINRHVSFEKMADIFGRPVAGIKDHVYRHHRATYEASGHPSCQPAKSEAAHRRHAKKTARKLKVVPQAVLTVADLTEALARIDARVSKLEQDLGVES